MTKKAATKKPQASQRPKASSSQAAAEQRRVLFIEAYLANGGNATNAAKAAGFSEKTAHVQGCVLLKHPKVIHRLDERRKELSQKYALTTENVMKSLSQAIFFDPRNLYDQNGNLKAIADLDDDTAQALSGFEVTEERGDSENRSLVTGYTKKVKWLDKNTAREQAMKHLGLYEQDNKQRNPLEGLPREVIKEIVDKLGATGGRG